MKVKPLKDFERLCVHTITTKPWNIEEAVEHFSKSGVRGISVWRDTLENRDVVKTGRMIRDHGLEVVSLVRGGFFPSVSKKKRRQAVDDNKEAIDEAAALGSPLVVLVCGADPAQSLEVSRKQIREGIEAILPYAEDRNVSLAVEPLHPMYADTRSAINTLAQANDLVENINAPALGVAVDVYHLWWDPALEKEIKRCGSRNKIFAFHICDWLSPTKDMLTDRGLMGEGCIPVRQIRGWVEQAGFRGYVEVEIFSERWWATDQQIFLDKIKKAYLEHA